jgi:hypothetical protein
LPRIHIRSRRARLPSASPGGQRHGHLAPDPWCDAGRVPVAATPSAPVSLGGDSEAPVRRRTRTRCLSAQDRALRFHSRRYEVNLIPFSRAALSKQRTVTPRHRTMRANPPSWSSFVRPTPIVLPRSSDPDRPGHSHACQPRLSTIIDTARDRSAMTSSPSRRSTRYPARPSIRSRRASTRQRRP